MKVLYRFIIVVVIFSIVDFISKKLFGENNAFMTLIIGIPFSFLAIVFAISGDEEKPKK